MIYESSPELTDRLKALNCSILTLPALQFKRVPPTPQAEFLVALLSKVLNRLLIIKRQSLSGKVKLIELAWPKPRCAWCVKKGISSQTQQQ